VQALKSIREYIALHFPTLLIYLVPMLAMMMA
jgi:hypothetical protein